jgi:acyl-homoserine-lactone acylase
MRQLAILFVYCIIAIYGYPQKGGATINWDELGVPHIYAPDDQQLFYAEGRAQMQLHGDLILQLYGRSRGRAAEYWGKEKLAEDIMLNTLGFPELAIEWTAKQDPAYNKLLAAFVQGMNDYANEYPDAFKKESRLVLPVSITDVTPIYLCHLQVCWWQ